VKRREFITLLGGAAATWPLAAGAQQDERMRRIGVLLPATPDDAQYQDSAGAFAQGLAQLGWSIGRNVRIDTRWATVNAVAIRRQAAELVAVTRSASGCRQAIAGEPGLQVFVLGDD
jgi:putative tryptophan/tyrosine transport system substrate-binding protein